MKKFLVELTEEQAEAVGYALKNAIRSLLPPRGAARVDIHSENLAARCNEAYHALDFAPEAVGPSSKHYRVALAAKAAPDIEIRSGAGVNRA